MRAVPMQNTQPHRKAQQRDADAAIKERKPFLHLTAAHFKTLKIPCCGYKTNRGRTQAPTNALDALALVSPAARSTTRKGDGEESTEQVLFSAGTASMGQVSSKQSQANWKLYSVPILHNAGPGKRVEHAAVFTKAFKRLIKLRHAYTGS